MKPHGQTEIEQIEQVEAEIAAELPELLARADRREAAMKEESVSGRLRRALRTRPVRDVAVIAGVDDRTLADWMCGDISLPSDAIDRLARELNLNLEVQTVP
jgi:hypothetical protein